MNRLNPKKILLIKHGSLGDIAFALEPILAIQNKFNNSVIFLGNENNIGKIIFNRMENTARTNAKANGIISAILI